MLGTLLIDLYLLFAIVGGEYVTDHQSLLMEQNCSARLNISLHHPDLSRGDNHVECPPWFIPNNVTGGCSAGPPLDGLVQQEVTTLQTIVMQCYCMTEVNGITSVGFCLHTCLSLQPYYTLPCHVSQLQNFTCPPYLNRQGQFCSECIQGYAYPVYSYSLSCVKCVDYTYNWLKYLAAAYLPLTFFYILVAIFSISFTSPILSGVVTTFQLAANPISLMFIHQGYGGDIENRIMLKIIATFASVWNLDFVRLFYSFCLHLDASALQLSALEYGIVVYPVVLILITHQLVKLHDRNFWLIVLLWKPFNYFIKPLRKYFNLKTSLVDVFASFLYLSSCRLLLTSVYILFPTVVYTVNLTSSENVHVTNEYCVMNDEAIVYLSQGHYMFALLAIVLFSTFLVLPMILLFIYPFSCFQRVLNKTGLNSLILRTFIDSFQGYYKDGTDGTKDCRFFSGFLLLFPLLTYISFSQTDSIFFYCIVSIWIVIYLTLTLLFQPFKKTLHYYITITMLIALLALCWSAPINNANTNENYTLSFILAVTSMSVPFIYLFGLVCIPIKWKFFPERESS